MRDDYVFDFVFVEVLPELIQWHGDLLGRCLSIGHPLYGGISAREEPAADRPFPATPYCDPLLGERNEFFFDLPSLDFEP